MMKYLVNFLTIALLSVEAASTSAQVARSSDINLLPMYGKFEKSRALQKADANLLAKFPNRKDAATQFANRGWDYFYINDLTTAIKRFNQAWLLDSTNASAYWGFGVIEGRRGHHTEALRYFQTSLRHNPTNRRLLVDIGQALLDRYLVTRHLPDLNTAMQQWQQYLTDTTDAKGTADAYMRLAAAYYYKRDYLNAWKYLDLTKALDAAAFQSWPMLAELQQAAPR